jgi:hypothetical protein
LLLVAKRTKTPSKKSPKKSRYHGTPFSGYLPDIRRFQKKPSAPLGAHMRVACPQPTQGAPKKKTPGKSVGRFSPGFFLALVFCFFFSECFRSPLFFVDLFLSHIIAFWAFLGEGSPKMPLKKKVQKYFFPWSWPLPLFWPLTHPPTTGHRGHRVFCFAGPLPGKGQGPRGKSTCP